MRNLNQPTSLAFRLILVLLIFALCTGLGALSHLSWLAVERSRVLSSSLIMVALALCGYLYFLRRRYVRPPKRRPLEDLVKEVESIGLSTPAKKTGSQSLPTVEPVDAESAADGATEESEPPTSPQP